jgi:hypothetical protein
MKKEILAIEMTRSLMEVAKNPPVTEEKLEEVISQFLEKWETSITLKLRAMVDDWETEVPDDTSLYTLGLRRAIDVVRGDDPVLPTA